MKSPDVLIGSPFGHKMSAMDKHHTPDYGRLLWIVPRTIIGGR